jgi:septal ring factor EnvC (AmiA/AmiB activator)
MFLFRPAPWVDSTTSDNTRQHFDLIDSKLDNLSTQLDQLSARIRASHTSATAIDNKLSSINDRLSSIQVSLFVVVGIVLLNIRMQR